MRKEIVFFVILIISFQLNLFSQDFEVAPTRVEYSIDPGESQTATLSIKNHSNFKMPFLITLADFTIDAEGNEREVERNSIKNSCSEWITPEKTFFDINPNEQVDIKITMQAPEDDMADRWAKLYVQTAQVQTAFEADKDLRTGVQVSGRIGIKVFRYTNTKKEPDIKIGNLKEVINEDTTSRIFTAVVENEGETISECKVIFVAADIETGEEFEFDPIYILSYPGYQRKVEFKLPDFMPPGKYSFVALLDYGKTTTIKGTRLKDLLIIQPQN